MSMLTEQLCCRRLKALRAGGCQTLACVGRGEQVRVVGFVDGLDLAVARRFHDLGFAEGALVEMVRKAPMGDPLIFRVADYEIALRKAQAAAIAVEPARGCVRSAGDAERALISAAS